MSYNNNCPSLWWVVGYYFPTDDGGNSREGYSEINVHSKESECVGVDFIFFNYVNFI